MISLSRKHLQKTPPSTPLDAMTYIPLHLPSILLPTPWLQVLPLAPGDPLQHLITPVKIPLISLAHINITPAPSDDAAETQIN